MKRFIIRCAVAGAMIGGAAAASFSAVSSGMSMGVASTPATVRTVAAAQPAAPAAAVSTGTISTAAVSQAVTAPGAPSVPAGNAQSCVGAAVSAAQQTLKGSGESFGDTFKDSGTGLHPGDAIKAYATSTCGKH